MSICHSSTLVRSAICSIGTDSGLLDSSNRSKIVKKQVKSFLSAVVEENCSQQFEQFCVTLTKTIEKNLFVCVSTSGTYRSKGAQREKLWSSFHQLRITQLADLWRQFLSQPNIPNLSPLVYQHVNQKIYEDQMKAYISAETAVCDSVPSDYPQITEDEENILRYAAGYVPYKLLKKYECHSSLISQSYVECLMNLAINGEESSLMEYTSKWIALCNRGGLFEINDTCYLMFRDIELKVRKHLFSVLGRTTSCDKDTIVCSVASDESVQFYWTMLSVDIEQEEHAILLLKEIVGLWVTVRGFSIAGNWLEQYKQSTKQSSHKGLRKEMKKSAKKDK